MTYECSLCGWDDLIITSWALFAKIAALTVLPAFNCRYTCHDEHWTCSWIRTARCIWMIKQGWALTWTSNGGRMYYPGQKKEPCCWCIKSESCDIEESRCLIQLRNRERTRLATAATLRIDAPQQNQTADSSISDMMHQKDGSFFLARVVHWYQHILYVRLPALQTFFHFNMYARRFAFSW